MSELGDRIKQARVRAMMSQAHLAGAAGLSERTVKRAEAGEGLSAETLRALSAALKTTFEPPVEEPREAVRYAGLVPPARPVAVEGPTGLLDLRDPPVWSGLQHGILAGLSIPGTCRSAPGFLAEYGPDNRFMGEAQTVSAYRQRVYWIDRAIRKATDPIDRREAEALRVEADNLVLEAERTEAEALRRHHAWNEAFCAASLISRVAVRIAQVTYCVGLPWLLVPGVVQATLVAMTAFLVTGLAGMVGMVLRFDATAARAIKGRLFDEMTYRERKQTLDVHASGLTP